MLVLYLILILVTLVTLIYFIKKQESFKVVICIVLFIILIMFVFWNLYERNYQYVSSTDLSNESVNGLQIRQFITSEDLVELEDQFGEQKVDPEMPIMIFASHDQSLKYKQWFFGTMDNQISTIVTEHPNAETVKNIKVGDRIDTVINRYGNHYFSTDEEIGETIGYIDRENNIVLQFVIYDRKVYQIILMSN